MQYYTLCGMLFGGELDFQIKKYAKSEYII